MLIFNHDTAGDGDNRDVIQGSFGCPNSLSSPGLLNHIFKYPRVWDRVPVQSNRCKRPYNSPMKNTPLLGFYNLMLDENAHYYKTKNNQLYLA